jgi:hypothetical protein
MSSVRDGTHEKSKNQPPLHMTKRSLPLIALICLLSCSSPKRETAQGTAQRIKPPKKELSGELSIENIGIPLHWTELTSQNGDWIYLIPCYKEREVQTIEISRIDGQAAISQNTGTEGQWYAIRRIEKQYDSFIFHTVLPFDTPASTLFTFRYIDEPSSMARWNKIDGPDYEVSQYYVSTPDTLKYERVM